MRAALIAAFVVTSLSSASPASAWWPRPKVKPAASTIAASIARTSTATAGTKLPPDAVVHINSGIECSSTPGLKIVNCDVDPKIVKRLGDLQFQLEATDRLRTQTASTASIYRAAAYRWQNVASDQSVLLSRISSQLEQSEAARSQAEADRGPSTLIWILGLAATAIVAGAAGYEIDRLKR